MKKISDIYQYTDEYDNVVYESVRFTPKAFKQRRKYRNNYIWGISAGEYYQKKDGDYYRKRLSDSESKSYMKFPGLSKHYPYHLSHMMNSEYVFLVEGEKDVHSLEQIGCIATTNSGGISSFHQKIRQYFIQKNVYILCDNDEAGIQGSYKRASLLYDIAKEVIVIPPFLHMIEHADISNWIQANPENTKEKLFNIVNSTQPYIFEHTKKPKKHKTTQQKKVKSIDQFLHHFRDVSLMSTSNWLAHCPCHNDSIKSLSISLQDNKILLYCFAGCKTYDIVQALHLSWNDLFL